MNRKILQAAVAASALAYGATASAQTAPKTAQKTAENAPIAQNTNANANQPPPAPGEVQVRAESVGPKSKPPNRALLIGGASLLGVTYATSVVVAIQSTRGADHLLYIPVGGPWADLASRSCTDTDPCHNEAISAILLITDGVAQLAGAGLIAASFFVPEQAAKLTTTVGSAEFTVSPAQMGVGGWGLAAVGDF